MYGRISLIGFNSRILRIDYLVVAGGGGGGAGIQNSTDAGAGGGGQVIVGSIGLRRGTSNVVVVGLGGNPGSFTIAGQRGFQGGTSTFLGGVISANGGVGGNSNLSSVTSYGFGGAGGPGTGGSPSGFTNSFDGIGGRSGGAGGGAATSASGVTPGSGIVSSITGIATEYGRGGLPAANGGDFVLSPPGRGGAGGKGSTTQTSGFGGVAGVVIIRYVNASGEPAKATGGSIINLNGFSIHTFNSNDIFVVL